MIRSVEIQDFRGIHEGKLDGLCPLVILVGKNGSGKSTILDALYLALSTGEPALHQIMNRRENVPDAMRWMRYRGEPGAALITFTLHGEASPFCYKLDLRPNQGVGGIQGAAGTPLPSIRLVEPRHGGHHQPLVSLFSDVARQGYKKDVNAVLATVIPGFDELQILTSMDSPSPVPVLHVGYRNRSVPVAYAGDGVYSLVVTTLELASQPGGTVLIEEPEVHQYPGALRQTAAVIAASVARGVQVILSTHSLELIDALVAAATERKILDKLQLIRLALDEGTLKTSSISGPDVAFARNQIDDDLR